MTRKSIILQFFATLSEITDVIDTVIRQENLFIYVVYDDEGFSLIPYQESNVATHKNILSTGSLFVVSKIPLQTQVASFNLFLDENEGVTIIDVGKKTVESLHESAVECLSSEVVPENWTVG